MSAETCTRSQCPEMPKVTLDQAVIDLMESIALSTLSIPYGINSTPSICMERFPL